MRRSQGIWRCEKCQIILLMKEGGWSRRLSLREQAERAERRIFQVLREEQPQQQDEESSSHLHFHLRRFSKPVLPLSPASPRDGQPRKLPPILRYLSQKFVKQAESRREEEDYLYKGDKKFKIHTQSLQKLESSRQHPAPFRSNRARHSLHEEASEMVVRKLQLNKAVTENREKEKRTPRPAAEMVPERTLGNNGRISGWHTTDEDAL